MARTPHLTSRLQRYSTTIFTEMSALALSSGAVNLGQGFPDFDAPPAVTEAAQRAIAEGKNQYAPGNGIPRLRRAIAAHADAHHGLAYDPDTEVTVTTGATEAIFATMAALLDVGDEVVLLEPYYDSYRASVSMAGGVPVGVPLRRRNAGNGRLGAGWRLDPADLMAAVNPSTRAIVVNTPHNPLGKVFDDTELAAIIAAAESVDAVVVADEVYEHLTFSSAHRSVCHLPGGRERTVRISSAAKTFSVTGWKVGWACAPPELTAAVRAAKQWTTFTSGTPFQHAIAEALTYGDDYFGPWTQDYRRRRDHLCEALDDVGLGVTVPDGTFFIACDIRPLGFTDDVDFCRRLTTEVGVGAIPISVFHDDPASARGFARFAFCKTDEALKEGVRRLSAGLPDLPRSAD